MGNKNSGRRPSPTSLKVLRGNPGKRPLNASEPAFAVASPAFDAVPPELSADSRAADEWRRLAPMLRAVRMVSEAERSALIALCQQWSRYLGACVELGTSGMTVRDRFGVPVPSPWLRVADAALAHCRALWAELGMTPASRSRVAQLPAAEASAAPSKWHGLLS